MPFRILLVEDDPDLGSAILEFFQAQGHGIILVGDGERAIQEFKPGMFDAAIVDIGLPGLNGWEVVKEIRRQDKDISIIVQTAWDYAMSDARRAFADEIRVKPVRARELLGLITAMRLKKTG